MVTSDIQRHLQRNVLRHWLLGPCTEFSINLLRLNLVDSLDLLTNQSSVVGRYGYPRGEL